MKYGKRLVVVYKHDNDNNILPSLPPRFGTVSKMLYYVRFTRSITGYLFRCFMSLTILTISIASTFDSADARHRRRHHARPEIHRNLRPVDAGVRPIGQCNFTTWDEVNPDSISYPYATGSTVVDLTGRFPWN